MPPTSKRKRSRLENLAKATSPEPANVATELVADSGLPPTSSSFSTTPLLETGYDKNKSTIQLYNTLEKYVEHSRNNYLEESGNRDMNPTQSMMPANKKMRSYKSLDGTYENTSFGDLQKLWKNLRRSGSQMYTIEVHYLPTLQK
jgi:hypothetical protein